MDELTEEESNSLIWLHSHNKPVFSIDTEKASVLTIRTLVKKKLARVCKVINHPNDLTIKVSCFCITRKGKKWVSKLDA